MPNVLFVCTANICRSPMAMVLFERKLKELNPPGKWVVGSAGTWAREGDLASQHGRDLMAEWGMDLSKHRSRVVNTDILEAADIILTMEQGHAEALRAEFPQVAHKVHMLSEMIGIQANVDDPYGGTPQEYRETALEIDGYLNKGFGRIVELILQNTKS